MSCAFNDELYLHAVEISRFRPEGESSLSAEQMKKFYLARCVYNEQTKS